MAPTSNPDGFDRIAQARRLLTSFAFRWTWTAVLCGAIAGTIYGYRAVGRLPSTDPAFQSDAEKGTSSDNQKRTFQAILTGLQIGLAINITDSLNQFIATLRWWLVSRVPLQPAIFDKVLMLANVWSAASTIVKRRAPLYLRFFCFVWVTIFLIANIGTATIGLTIDIFPAQDVSGESATKSGTGLISNLNLIAHYEDDNQNAAAQRVSSQAFVQAGLTGYLGLTSDDGPTINNYRLVPSSERVVPALTLYTFGEGQKDTIDGESGESGIRSDRVLPVQTACEAPNVTRVDNSTNPDRPVVSYRCSGLGGSCNLTAQNNLDHTLTAFSMLDAGPDPRTTSMLILTTEPGASNPRLYSCNVTVMQVSDFTVAGDGTRTLATPLDAPFGMPNAQAKIWAGALGWTAAAGSGEALQQSAYSFSVLPVLLDIQETPEGVADYVSNLTLAAVADYDQTGTNRTTVHDYPVPADSFSFVVKTPFVILNLVLIAGLHFVFALATVAAVHNVKIVDESALAIALALRSTISNVSLSAAMEKGKMVAGLVPGDVKYVWRGDFDPVTVPPVAVYASEEKGGASTSE